jgi:hypothetical protein
MRLFLVILLLMPCLARAAVSSGGHEAYVWQRRWTPELAATAAAMAPQFAGYRVLVGEIGTGGEVRVAVDWAALHAAARPLTLVLRAPGAAPQFDLEATVSLLDDAHAAALAAGNRVVGIEIDHDCARAQLPAYAARLRALRGHSALPLTWSITTLPDWLHSDALPELLATADASVLQLHAVLKPGDGLFDPLQALRWTRAYARLTPKPFRVALPAYATRVTQDADGAVVAIESDAATMPVFSAQARELVVDPRRVAVVLQRLREVPPPRYAGVAWFRLPLRSDRRSWAAQTLNALIAGSGVGVGVRVELIPVGRNFDVMLRNPHDVDAIAPGRVTLPSACRSGEGVAGYRFDAEAAAFTSDAPPLLKPGASRTIGWIACEGKGGA